MTAYGGTSISLGARLRHLAARLAHSGGCGIRHQPRIAENRAELVSLAETSNAVFAPSVCTPAILPRLRVPAQMALIAASTSGSCGSRLGVFPMLSERSDGPT